MKSIEISELSGPALDWAVIQTCGMGRSHDEVRRYVKPSSDWSQGGPMIERCGVSWICVSRMAGIPAPSSMNWAAWIGESARSYGETPLVAAMRAIVASKADSDTIEVPAELLSATTAH